MKDRTNCKSCYNINRRKNKNQQLKNDNTIHKKPIIKNHFESKTCHRHLIVGSSGHGRSYLMNYVLLKKQAPNFLYLQTHYINILISKLKYRIEFNHQKIMKTALFFLICCYQNKKAILICSLPEDDTVKSIYTTQPKVFLIAQKLLFIIILKKLTLFKQTLGDVIILFHHVAGLDMSLEE